jgi:long-chain acyl-CoA synthetase
MMGAGERFPVDPVNDVALSCLPLAHVFERMVTLYYLSQGISLYFAEEIKSVGDNLRELHPTIITLVPRLLEKVFLKMQNNIEEASGIKKTLGQTAFRRAVSLDHNRPKNLLDKIFDRLVYGKMRTALGGRLRLVISGSAALSERLQNFFLNIGIPLYEGYGCTETSPVIAANFPGCRKKGTVGKAFPGVEIKIAGDGEILARGPNVMRAYFKKPKETAQCLTKDGWYHTGDLGRLDDRGVLTITGRKKELFKTAGGKYVAPGPIEALLVSSEQYIDMAMIIAEGRKFVSALIFPDFENLGRLKSKIGCGSLSDSEFLSSETAGDYFQRAVTKVNTGLNQWEKIQKFILADTPASVESGELTPTMKLRRHIIEDKFHKAISAIYQEA